MNNVNVPSQKTQIGGWLAWLVVLVSALFFFYEFLQMNMFNTINADLMRAFNIDGTKISNLSAGYFYADILLLFPAGIILDKFSTRKLLSCAMLVSVAATFCLSLTDNYWFAFAMRLLSGFGAAFNLLSSLKLASRWFEAKHLALVTGAVVTMAMLGGVVAQTPMTLLVAQVGWRHAVQIDAAVGVLFLVLIVAIVRDFPKGYIEKAQQTVASLGVTQTVKKILWNRQNWFAGFYTCFLNLPILVLGALWGIQYLSQANGFTRIQASAITSMLFIGTIIGSPILGEVSDYLRQRKMPMIVGAIFSLIVILLIRYIPTPSFTMMMILFFVLGFVTSSQVISYPLITESNPLSLTGSALGMASVIIMAGGAIFQPVMGWLLDLHWDGTKVHGVPSYSIADYHFAFMIFPITFVISFVFSFIVRETHATEEQ